MKKRNIFITALTGAVIVGGIYLYTNTGVVKALTVLQQSSASTQQAATGSGNGTTVQIQPAGSVVKAVSASGNIELVKQVDVADQVAGIVSQINVQAGDVITAGQPLLTLDTTDLQRAVALAQVAVENQKNTIAQLNEPATPENVATAKANLAAAQANLATLQAGPTQQQVSAAKSALAAAQAQYNDVVKPQNQDQLNQLKAAVDTTKVALDDAKRAWDKVSWQNLPGTTSQEATYQQAAIDYQSALAAYNEASKPATSSNVQAAVSSIQSAKQTLAGLSPTAAAIAAAQAQVDTAQSQLDTLLAGTDPLTIKDAGFTLQQDLISLQQAEANLVNAQVRSPIAGTVLAVNATVGQQISAGAVVASVADPSQLQLTVNVAEVDVTQLKAGQDAQVAIDAFPGQSFQGQVSKIEPVGTSTSGVINYPVTILLTDNKLGAVRPSMTAVATMSSAGAPAADEWFVPTNAIQQQSGSAVVDVVRNNATVPIQVTTGQVKGDWTRVKSAQLLASDQVVGSVTSKLSNSASPFVAGRGSGGIGGAFGGAAGRQNRAAP